MTHLYLIRHGEHIDAEDGKYLDNPGLSLEGMRQGERLRDRLARTGEIQASVLLTSPLCRAQESAQILASALGQPVIVDEDFSEWRSDNGNLMPDEFSARWQQTPVAQRPFFRWADGCETWLEFSVRIQQALNRVLQEHEGKTLVLVTHGEVIQAAFLYFFGLSALNTPAVSLDNMSLTHWFTTDHSPAWILERFNDSRHA